MAKNIFTKTIEKAREITHKTKPIVEKEMKDDLTMKGTMVTAGVAATGIKTVTSAMSSKNDSNMTRSDERTQKEFEKKHDSIYSSLNKERNLSDFYFIVSPFVASVKDGHTNFTIPATQDRIDYLNNGGLTLPLRLKIVENKILVDFPLISCSIQENDEIICIKYPLKMEIEI